VSHRNDLKRQALLNQGIPAQAMSDMTLAWLKSLGATANTIPDAWWEYLTGQGYSGSLGDMQYTWLGDLGFTGTISDRWHAFWASGGTVVDPFTQEVVLLGDSNMVGAPPAHYGVGDYITNPTTKRQEAFSGQTMEQLATNVGTQLDNWSNANAAIVHCGTNDVQRPTDGQDGQASARDIFGWAQTVATECLNRGLPVMFCQIPPMADSSWADLESGEVGHKMQDTTDQWNALMAEWADATAGVSFSRTYYDAVRDPNPVPKYPNDGKLSAYAESQGHYTESGATAGGGAISADIANRFDSNQAIADGKQAFGGYTGLTQVETDILRAFGSRSSTLTIWNRIFDVLLLRMVTEANALTTMKRQQTAVSSGTFTTKSGVATVSGVASYIQSKLNKEDMGLGINDPWWFGFFGGSFSTDSAGTFSAMGASKDYNASGANDVRDVDTNSRVSVFQDSVPSGSNVAGGDSSDWNDALVLVGGRGQWVQSNRPVYYSIGTTVNELTMSHFVPKSDNTNIEFYLGAANEIPTMRYSDGAGTFALAIMGSGELTAAENRSFASIVFRLIRQMGR